MQFDSITSPIDPGLTLLEAGAGTGKTYSLVRIIARQLVEKQIPLDQILTVTFTRAATAEIKGRLHELLGEVLLHLKNPPKKEINDLAKHWLAQGDESVTQAISTLSIALANFDSVPIFTIDGFFQRLLKEYAFESQVLFSVELDTDENALIETAVRDYWRQNVYPLNRTDLDRFTEQVTLDEACSFICELRRTGDVTLDPAYAQTPSAQIDNYAQYWTPFVELLNKHREDLEEFVTNPPAGIKKSFAPFKSNTTKSFLNEVDQILTAPDTLLFHLGRLNSISASRLFSEEAFNNGKYIDLSDYALADLFRSIDTLNEQAPENLKSAYLGEIYHYVMAKLRTLKQERNIQSYSDVTDTLAKLLTSSSHSAEAMQSAVKQNYQAALIDEFQDTSPQQCKVFLNLFHHPDRYFHIIGDPKQSIYRFRGADVFSYIKASEKADHKFELLVNYRSSPRMIHAVNHLFSMADDPFLVDQRIKFSPAHWQEQGDDVTPPDGASSLYFHALDADLRNANTFSEAIYQSICNEVIDLLGTSWEEIAPGSGKKGKVSPSDIAILVYSGKEGSAINDRLSALHVPVATNTRTSLLQSSEAKEVLSILSALIEPWRAGALRAALLTPALGSGHALANDDEFDRITNEAADLHATWHEHGLMPMMLDMLNRFQIRSRLLKLSQGRRRITNFMHLIELLDTKAREQKLTPSATLQWLEMAIQGSIIDMDSEVLELRIASDDASLQILTQHSSKGLEFPIVFATPPCHRTFSNFVKPDLSYHDPESLETWFDPFGNASPPSYDLRKREACADRARLAYVALTRSQYRCHFYYIPEKPGKEDEHAVYQMLGFPTAEDLEELATASSGCITYSPVSHDIFDLEPSAYKATVADTATDFSTRPNKGIEITRRQGTTSFTGITKHSEGFTDVAQDVDATVEDAPMAPDTGFWSRLQAGASLGSAFHEILEDLDFQNPENIGTLIREKLTSYSPWRETPSEDELGSLVDDISSSLQHLLEHPLTEGITLSQIPLEKRLTEPSFLLSGSNFTLSSLCDILASDPPKNLPPHYIDQLRRMSRSEFEGFLIGFIDLIFEHDGRFHLLDWKTNRIPNNSSEAMAGVMAEHHYYLQYHLYSLALDRLLSQRLGDAYSPEKHLGNIYYVFFRGVDPAIPGSGIYTDTLTAPRLDALRSAFTESPATA